MIIDNRKNWVNNNIKTKEKEVQKLWNTRLGPRTNRKVVAWDRATKTLHGRPVDERTERAQRKRAAPDALLFYLVGPKLAM